jgi:hypothetical protein
VLASLEVLVLRACPIEDEALVPLRALTTLRVLDLRECEGLTPDGVRALAGALPSCRIER